MSKPTKPPKRPFLAFAESIPESVKANPAASLEIATRHARRNTQAARHGKQAGGSTVPDNWQDVYHGEALRHYHSEIAKSEERAAFVAAWVNDPQERSKRRFAREEAGAHGLKFATANRALQSKEIRRPQK